MEYLEVEGGNPLRGSVPISGAKNAALPLIIASLLTAERCEFENVPNLEDLGLLLHILEQLGAETQHLPAHPCGGSVAVRATKISRVEASYSLIKALRASFWVLAPLLARTGHARVALPGGDIIGARPVDLHLAALTQMGAEISVKHGTVIASAPRGLRPAKIDLRFPSVGATHQILMAAALTSGTTVLNGAAREPEVVALAEMLQQMGAEISGAGEDQIIINGRSELGGAKIQLIGDRIEAGTYLLAGAMSGGEVTVTGIAPQIFEAFLRKLEEMGIEVTRTPTAVTAKTGASGLTGVQVSTAPFPGFPTDLQAPFMSAMTIAKGESAVEENIYEGRYGHVSELCRMGALIAITERTATITGVPALSGAPVEIRDIRAGAALVIAALSAKGRSQLFEPYHLWRGYDALEYKIRSLGGRLWRSQSDREDYEMAGC